MTTKTETSGFTLLRQQDVPLIQATVYEFEHTTGAKLLHFAADDEDLSFAGIMPTVPTNEKGEPHILEHCLFSGSKHYPDAASRGALLATGGGAWTGWEYTWYFMSSPREADFLKRIDIWCDSLFEPLLERETFEYQAHHLEFEDPDDPSTPLRYRGVIYNEQKGILGHPIAVSWYGLCRALFPGHPYSLEHGGTPRDVPTITYEELKAFHERHYHPAKAHFLTYGNLSVEALLETFDEALTRVPERPVDPVTFPELPSPSGPVRYTDKLPIGAGDDPSGRSVVLMGWVGASAADAYESFVHDVISELLLGTPSAPLRAALATSGLGKTVAETFDRYGIRYRRHTIAAGIADTDPDKADAIERVITETLERLARDGFDDDTVDAALNKIEFMRRTLRSMQGHEGSITSFWLEHINTPWLLGADPFERLSIGPWLDRFNEERTTGRPIEDRIRKWFLDNPHRALVTLEPDPGADGRLQREEDAELAAIKDHMSDEDKRAVIENTKRLRAHLDAASAPPPAPSADALRRREVPSSVAAEAAGVRVEAYPTRTNGITYVDLVFDIGSLPDDLWDYVRLFSAAVTRSGGDAIQKRAGIISDGFSSDVMVPVCGTGDEHRRLLRLGGRTLERNTDEFIDLLCTLAGTATFDGDVVRSVLDDTHAHAEQFVFIDATGYLKRLAGSRLRTSWALRERLDGFAQLDTLRALGRTTSFDEVLAKLEQVRTHIAQRGCVDVFVAASDAGAIDRATHALSGSLEALTAGGAPAGRLPERRDVPLVQEARTFGQPTAFNCEVWSVPSRSHPDGAAVLVGGSIASSIARGDVVRGGTAYSAACDAFSDPGTLACWSIRDPNIVRTYDAFESAVAKLRAGEFDGETFALAKLEASIAWNLPAPPARVAFRSFVGAQTGFGPDDQAGFAEAVASLSKRDVQRAAEEHLSGPAVRASLTSADMAQQAGFFDVIADV